MRLPGRRPGHLHRRQGVLPRGSGLNDDAPRPLSDRDEED